MARGICSFDFCPAAQNLTETKLKIVSTISRYLLGLMFTVFGLNGFLNFIHQPLPTNPLALQFFIAISSSHFAVFFFAVQLIAGLLLLSGYFVPLGLTLLTTELYNILDFHLTFAPQSIAPVLVACVLWTLVFLNYRESFRAILRPRGAACRNILSDGRLACCAVVFPRKQRRGSGSVPTNFKSLGERRVGLVSRPEAGRFSLLALVGRVGMADSTSTDRL